MNLLPSPNLVQRSTRETDERLDEIERALRFDPDPEYRRELRREYLALTDPKEVAE